MSWLLGTAVPLLALMFCLCGISGPISREEQVDEDRRAYLKAQEGRNP